MADIGTLNFGVHLHDYTDAEADKIKKKLENMSIKLNIDASSSKVSNTDSIKTQIENAIKNININSVKVDANAVKTQIESATQNLSPKITVTLLKGSLSNDIQTYLDTKVFKIKISITASQVQSDIVQAMGNISIPVKVRVDSNFMIQQLQQSLSKRSVPISVRANDVKTFVKDLETKLSKTSTKIPLDANWQVIRSSVQNALRGQTFTANLKLVVSTASVDDAIKQAFAKAGMRYNPIGGNAAANANRNLANSYRQAAGAADQFARASVSLNNGLHTNIRLGGQLGTILGNLASVVGMKDLLGDVVLIGGQLENQRIALGAILQDGGKATAMFSKIQSLAVKSPFGIMDLNQYVKQLSAYSVPYNELYETMKRLADISAGVGVDMGRIILAFGQVKAAGFLKGTELRQFTEANIPMVDKLAERFTNLTGEMISAGEVYDMISKKQIAFEDVKAVLWDLTDEGGMFNNMQEVLSESLASKWKNLADAVDVMFGKIADGGVGSGLKWIAELLTDITKGWKYVGAAIGSALGSFLLYKAAVVLGSKQMAAATNLYTSTLANKRVEARNLQIEKSFRNLTKAEQQLMATTNKLTVADLKQLVRSGQLNKTQALRLISLKKLDAQTLAYIKRLYQLTDAQIKLAQSSTWFARAGYQFANGLGAIGTALKSLFLSPMTWVFAAITAITEVWTYFSNKSAESDQRIKDSLQSATEGYKNLSNALKEVEGTPNTDAGLISGIERMTTTLKDYTANWAELLGKIYEKDESGDYVNDLEARYELLKEKLLQTKEAYELLSKSMYGFSESANDATDGVWDESLIDNLKDLSESMSKYNKHLNAITINSISYKEAIEAAAEADEEFAKAITGKDFREQINLLKDYEKAADEFGDYLYNNKHSSIYLEFEEFESVFENLKSNLETAKKDIKTFAVSYKELLKGIGTDVNNLNEIEKIAIGINLTEFIDKIEGLDEETKKLFYQEVLDKEFKIKVTAKFEEGVNEERWRLELIKAAGGEKLEEEVRVMIKAASDYESVVEEVRKMYKDANEVVNDLNPVLLKAGISFKAGEEVDENNAIFWGLDYETQKAIKEWNKAVRQIKAAQNIANDQGFLLTNKKRGGGGSGKDPIAEMWKQRTEEIEKAVAAYDKWKKVEGASKAEQRIKGMDEFANLFNGKYGFNLDLESPTDAYRFVQSKLNQAKEEQRELYVKLGVKLSDAELKDAQDRLKASIDDIDKYIKKTSENWDLYKRLYKATGNQTLSFGMSFGNGDFFETEAEYYKRQIEEKMKELGITISFSKLIEMDTKSLEEGGFKALTNLIKAYNDANQQLKKETVNTFIEIVESSKDFAQQIADAQEELQRKLNAIYASSLPQDKKEQYEKQIYEDYNEKVAEINFEKFKKSSDWVKIFDDLDRVSSETIDSMIEKIEEFSDGGIESEKVLKQVIKALRQLREEAISRNPFKAFDLSNILSLGEINAEINRLKKEREAAKKRGDMDTYTKLGEQINSKKDDREAIQNNMSLAMDVVYQEFSKYANALTEVTGLLEKFGNRGLKNLSNVINNMVSGMQSGMSIGGLFGGAGKTIGGFLGTAVGVMGALVEAGQKAVEAEQERSQVVIDRLSQVADLLKDSISNSLSGLYDATLDATSRLEMERLKANYDAGEDYFKNKGQKIEDDSIYVGLLDTMTTSFDLNDYIIYSKKTHDAINKALEYDNAYMATYASLLAQRDELYYQKVNYTNKDEDKVEAYRRDKQVEIEKLSMEINMYTRDMLASLYSVDFQGWASQFADSIVSAWASGEDAAEAYGKTVGEVMRNVATSMVQQAIIGKYLQDNLQPILDMFQSKNGVMDDEMFNALTQLVGGVEGKIEETEKFLDALETVLNNHDYSMKDIDDASKSGLSKGIQGVTEDTASLLASYINAIRAEVSIKRTMLEKLVAEDIPQISVLAQAQLTQLNNIAANTLRNADAADRIYELFNRVIDKGSNKIKI